MTKPSDQELMNSLRNEWPEYMTEVLLLTDRYESALKRIDELEEDCKKQEVHEIYMSDTLMVHRLNTTQAKLDIAVEALKRIAENDCDKYMAVGDLIALETLQKIKALDGTSEEAV